MSEFRYLDYDGLTTYTEHVKGYADGKIVYIKDESEIPDPPKEGTLYVIGSEILMDEEVIMGTQTTSTSLWTGKSIDTRLHDGKRIAYYLPYPSVNGTAISLVLELSDEDNTKNRFPIYANGRTISQSISGGCIIRMMYYANIIANGARMSGWICDGNVIPNNVTYSGSPVAHQVAIFDGTTGAVTSSGYTINSSVPKNAVFTDSTYSFKGIPSGISVTAPNTKYDVKTIPVINLTLDSDSQTSLYADRANSSLINNCVDGDLFIIKIIIDQTFSTPASINQLICEPTTYSIYNCFDSSAVLKLQSSGDHYILCARCRGSIKLLTNDDFSCISVPNANHATSADNVSYGNVIYCECSTGASADSKIVTSASSARFNLHKGAVIYVKFDYDNTSPLISLNVNDSGSKIVRYRNTVYDSTTSPQYPSWEANDIVQFVYTGTYWDLICPTITMKTYTDS